VGLAVVVRDGPRLGLVPLQPPAPVQWFPLDPSPERAVDAFLELGRCPALGAVASAIDRLPADVTAAAADRALRDAIAGTSRRSVSLVGVPELRAARGRLVGELGREARPFVLALATESLARAMRSPEEVLVALAREEERVERAVGRETRASAAFVAVPRTPLAEYAELWAEERTSLERHHAQLVGLLEDRARELLPSLSAVVGETVAARLLAAAGSLANLARMPASRLQLLGTRRRPSADRGPRFGLVYRAARMLDVPPSRQGAYARSLAALAVIAVRADATTHAPLGPALKARRDRRVERLRRSPR
jgi:hypothetical protein